MKTIGAQPVLASSSKVVKIRKVDGGEIYMLRIFAALIFATMFCTKSDAQQTIRNLNRDTIFKSMQCEIGLYAVKARRSGLDPSMKAHIKYTTSGTNANNAAVEAGFGGFLAELFKGPKLGVGYNFTRVDSATLEGKMNLNQGNTAVCVGRAPAIPLGIYDCLSEGTAALVGGFTQSCSRKVTAKATFNASGQFVAWIITIGPTWSYENTVSYEISVDAPAKN